MQLFKTEWLFEARPAMVGHEPRRLRFASRYGVARNRSTRPVCPPLQVEDAPGLSMIEHERAVLRFLAGYDRAA